MALAFVRVLNASRNIRLSAFKSLNNITPYRPQRLFHCNRRCLNKRLSEELQKIEVPKDFKQTRRRIILRYCAFTVCTGVVSFVGFRIVQYERTRRRITQSFNGWNKRKTQLQKYWNSLSAGQKVFYGLGGSYVAVFLLLRVPFLSPFMAKNFFCNVLAGKPITMLTSTFTHAVPIHLFFNTVVTFYMTTAIVDNQKFMGPEEYLALFLTAACFSALVSSISKMYLSSVHFAPSCGASGALYTMIGYYAMKRPDDIFLLFLFFPLPAYQMFGFLVCFDAVGLALGNRLMLDHGAHLGGALLGLIYSRYGAAMWDASKPIVLKWHELRNYFSSVK